MLDMRWMDNANFSQRLGRHMFGAVPAPARGIVKLMMRRMNERRLHGHGIGRLPRAEIAKLAISDIETLAEILGDNPFLTGHEPCAADASVFGIVTSILTPPLDSPLRAAMQQHAGLVAYRDRITERYFSERAAAKIAPFAASASPLVRASDHA